MWISVFIERSMYLSQAVMVQVPSLVHLAILCYMDSNITKLSKQFIAGFLHFNQ